MTLPANCGACTMHIAMLCRRHAPSPSLGFVTQGQKVAWPETRDTDRCGDASSTSEVTSTEYRKSTQYLVPRKSKKTRNPKKQELGLWQHSTLQRPDCLAEGYGSCRARL